jgi:hypothetical protein
LHQVLDRRSRTLLSTIRILGTSKALQLSVGPGFYQLSESLWYHRFSLSSTPCFLSWTIWGNKVASRRSLYETFQTNCPCTSTSNRRLPSFVPHHLPCLSASDPLSHDINKHPSSIALISEALVTGLSPIHRPTELLSIVQPAPSDSDSMHGTGVRPCLVVPAFFIRDGLLLWSFPLH